MAITELSYPSLYQTLTNGKFFCSDAAPPDTNPSDYSNIDAVLNPSISDNVNEMNKKNSGKRKV